MVRPCGNIFDIGCFPSAPAEQPPPPAAPQPLMAMVLAPLTQPNFWIWYRYLFLLCHLLPDSFQLLLILGLPHYPGMIHQQLYHYANKSLNFIPSFWKTYYCFSLLLSLDWSYRLTHTYSFPFNFITYQTCAGQWKGKSPPGNKMHVSPHPLWKL